MKKRVTWTIMASLVLAIVLAGSVNGCATTRPDGTTTGVDLEAVRAIAAYAPQVWGLYGQYIVLQAEIAAAQDAVERAALRADFATVVQTLIDLGVVPIRDTIE